jgi:hypothetical protein
MFPALVNATARNFQIAEVSADKAYSSKANLQLVDDKGGVPYISLYILQIQRNGLEWWHVREHIPPVRLPARDVLAALPLAVERRVYLFHD